jgi:hypothetical protein
MDLKKKKQITMIVSHSTNGLITSLFIVVFFEIVTAILQYYKPTHCEALNVSCFNCTRFWHPITILDSPICRSTFINCIKGGEKKGIEKKLGKVEKGICSSLGLLLI